MSKYWDNIKVTDTKPGKIITSSGFKGYDICINPYVGCTFGCKFCYVRFYIKDKPETPQDTTKEWGEFVRIKARLEDKLPKELKIHSGERLVIGTMMDPYQPIEAKERKTRKCLEMILDAVQQGHGLNKVGIFTRSPMIVQDIDLIRQLPNVRVHYSISPYPDSIIRKLEPIGISMRARWDSMQKLKDAGIRVHVNVAPAIPILSDDLTPDIAEEMGKIGIDEIMIDPMQAYSEAYEATKAALQGEKVWSQVDAILTDKPAYLEWKDLYEENWRDAWKPYHTKQCLPIWSDHIKKVWRHLVTSKVLDPRTYKGTDGM